MCKVVMEHHSKKLEEQVSQLLANARRQLMETVTQVRCASVHFDSHVTHEQLVHLSNELELLQGLTSESRYRKETVHALEEIFPGWDRLPKELRYRVASALVQGETQPERVRRNLARGLGSIQKELESYGAPPQCMSHAMQASELPKIFTSKNKKQAGAAAAATWTVQDAKMFFDALRNPMEIKAGDMDKVRRLRRAILANHLIKSSIDSVKGTKKPAVTNEMVDRLLSLLKDNPEKKGGKPLTDYQDASGGGIPSGDFIPYNTKQFDAFNLYQVDQALDFICKNDAMKKHRESRVESQAPGLFQRGKRFFHLETEPMEWSNATVRALKSVLFTTNPSLTAKEEVDVPKLMRNICANSTIRQLASGAAASLAKNGVPPQDIAVQYLFNLLYRSQQELGAGKSDVVFEGAEEDKSSPWVSNGGASVSSDVKWYAAQAYKLIDNLPSRNKVLGISMASCRKCSNMSNAHPHDYLLVAPAECPKCARDFMCQKSAEQYALDAARTLVVDLKPILYKGYNHKLIEQLENVVHHEEELGREESAEARQVLRIVIASLQGATPTANV